MRLSPSTPSEVLAAKAQRMRSRVVLTMRQPRPATVGNALWENWRDPTKMECGLSSCDDAVERARQRASMTGCSPSTKLAGYERWLGTEPDPREPPHPVPEGEPMTIWPISRRVNSLVL